VVIAQLIKEFNFS